MTCESIRRRTDVDAAKPGCCHQGAAGRFREGPPAASTIRAGNACNRRLNHPNILAIYDIGSNDSSPYIVSELLKGQTLRDRLGEAPVPIRKATEYGIQIAHGHRLAAHGWGLRDRGGDQLTVWGDVQGPRR